MDRQPGMMPAEAGNARGNRVCVYIVDIREFLNLDLCGYVSRARRARMERYLQPGDKARCLVAGLLERCVLGIEDGRGIRCGANGKPYLASGAGFYNLSHSGNLVVLCVSRREVGIDTEKMAGRCESVAEACFTPEERAQSAKDSGETFFRVWTAKEALMKATGAGLSLPPESFSVLPLDNSAHGIHGKSWYFEWKSYDDHMICTAADSAPHITYKPFDRERLISLLKDKQAERWN